ncbi:MAG: hypothetical protein MI864_28515, partial [Pseudomonadales bacterium]|nr:hypothetical protein [Pseudomonadales bacterium]
MVTMPAIAAPVLVSPNVDEIRLGQNSYYLEDPENRLDIGDTHRLAKNHWQPSPSDIPNFGYTDSTYWFRLQFNYSGTEPDRRLLAIDYALLDQVSVYVFKHKVLSREYHTGDTLPFDTRPLTHRDFLFPIAFQPGEETTVFIRVKTQGSTQVPMSLWKEQAYLLSDQTRLISQSIYYGMMIVMVLYNFFLFLSLRERAYLYYVGFVFSFLCMQASMHGVLFQYVFPDLPSLQELFVLFFVPSTMLFSCLFTESLLRLKSYAPRLSQSLRFIIVLSLGCIAGAFVLPYATSTQVSVFLVIPASILIFVSGPIAWYRGHKVARFFTIAWFSLLMGTTAAAMNKYGIIPRNGITEYGLQWGSALEAILLSFALADMLNREREARFKAQHAKLEEARRREIAEQKLIYQATHNATNG